MPRPKGPAAAGETVNSRYTIGELRALWNNFRGSPDEITLLEHFGLCEDRNEAIDLSQHFWKEYTQSLNRNNEINHVTPPGKKTAARKKPRRTK